MCCFPGLQYCGCCRATCTITEHSHAPLVLCIGCGIQLSLSCCGHNQLPLSDLQSKPKWCLACFWIAFQVRSWPIIEENWLIEFPSITETSRLSTYPHKQWMVSSLPTKATRSSGEFANLGALYRYGSETHFSIRSPPQLASSDPSIILDTSEWPITKIKKVCLRFFCLLIHLIIV